VDFVIRCVEQMRGGEVFVPKLPSMKITELLDVVAPAVEVDVIGIRPGEKLHETLVSEDEARHARELDDMFIIEPAQATWGFETGAVGHPLPPDYSYTSLNNTRWLSAQEMASMIE
jgi:FlaA1/EpsC-like NDP-sugar epimerase